MLKGDRTSFTDGFSIIKVMVSILSFVFIKSCFVYYIVFSRITVNFVKTVKTEHTFTGIMLPFNLG